MDIVSLINAPLDTEPLSEQDFIEGRKLLTMTAVCLEARRPLVLRPAAAVRVVVRRVVQRLHAARSDLGDGASILDLRLPSKRLDPSGSRRFSFLGAA